MPPRKPHANGNTIPINSSGFTPSPIPAKASNGKANIDIGLSNIIPTPARSSRSPKTSDSVEGASPSPKRQRVTRSDSLGHRHVDYDMKYHPMDDILRPNAAAKRRAYDHLPQQLSDDNESQGSSGEDSDLDIPKTVQKPITDHQTTPVRHRTTRAETLGGKPVDYDMKYHPMDDVLRPKAAAKRSVWFKSVSPTSLSEKTAMASKTWSIAKDDPKNPFTKPTVTDWKKLQAFDRRVYLLQKGSPINGNTLPLKWFKVVEALIEDGFFTREQLKAWGGVEALKSRYESVRKGIEGFFDAKPEPTNKMRWQIRHGEGFDVYGKGVGKKYWQSHGDSIVCPPSIKETEEALREQADSDNGDGEHDQPEVADSNEIRTVDADNDKTDAEELQSQGDETVAAVHNHDRAISEASSTSYHDVKQVLEAEDHLMESMRSAPSSEIGAPMMDDDELEAILGDMTTHITEAVQRESPIPSSSLSDPETLLLECRQKISRQRSTGNNAALAPKSPGIPTESPLPHHEVEALQSTTVAVVPPSVLKAAGRLEQQNAQLQYLRKSPRGKSVSAGSSKTANLDTLATNEGYEGLPNRKAPRKVYKRSARTKSSGAEFQVHEDQPGNTPLIKKQIALHPKSPGTDIKKENFGHHNRAEPDTTEAHSRLQEVLVGSPSTTRRPERHLATPVSTVIYGPTSTLQPSPAFVVADGRTSGIDRMGPNAFVTPLTPRSTRIRRV